MKQILFLFVMSIFIISCSEDGLLRDGQPSDDMALDFRGVKVDVCHNGNIINVSINAVPAHQAHGDAVDMDGDGYFDIDNDCGPTDCDDTNADLTDNCCAEECGFCEYIDLYDFDEPCDENSYYYGDYYCSRTYTWDYGDYYYYCGLPYNGYLSYSILYDYDYNNNCDTNDENDHGYIYAQHGAYTYCGEDYVYGYIGYYLYDNATGEYKVENSWTYDETQAGFDAAVFCGSVIDELAAELGLENMCEDYNFTSNDDEESSMKVNSAEEIQMKIKEMKPDLDSNLPEELRKKLTHLEGLSK
mgnify:CR=1 FL=1